MTSSTPDTFAETLLPPLLAFCERFHGALDDGHQVASPLGAWLLLALAATATKGNDRDACAEVLGMDVDRAAMLAGRLLESPPAAVSSAAALWTRPEFDTERLAEWRVRQPQSIVRSHMPTQAEADEWTRNATLDLIKAFPAAITAESAVVLATVLAAKSKWMDAYHPASSKVLSRPGGGFSGKAAPSPWASHVRRVLMSPQGSFQGIIRSGRAGNVAVHRMQAESGLVVTSVIAGRRVPRADVLAVAHEIATAGESRAREWISLFDLPLGHQELWSIEEDTSTEPGRHEVLTSYLPAWEAESSHDLLKMPLQLGAAAHALNAMLNGTSLPPAARQVALARYTRAGFEAAAISLMIALGSSASFAREPRGIMRRATLRFAHPFAVVAAVGRWKLAPEGHGEIRAFELGERLPVFSVWVTEPTEVERSDDDGDFVEEPS